MKNYHLFLFSLITLISYINSELRFVWKLISEGAKAPLVIDSKNRDMFDEEWTIGAGTLTAVGFRMQYLLGTKDRQTYTNFISQKYSAEEVYIRAGEYNTTVMSANSYLQGLFPSGTGPDLTPSQRNIAYPPTLRNFGDFDQSTFGSPALPYNIQVVPVHVFDNIDKKYFFMKFELCNPATDRFEDNWEEDSIESDLESFQSKYGSALMQILSQTDIDVFLEYEYVYNICNSFIADYIEGKVLKKFTDNGIALKDFNETCTNFHTTDLYDVRAGYNTDVFLPNATMSAFKDEITMWMDSRITKDNSGKSTEYTSYSNPKLVIFSVPDTTIAAIIAYVSKSKGIDIFPVPFASSLSFELNNAAGTTLGAQLTNEDYNVNLVYNGAVIGTYSYMEFREMINKAWSEEEVYDKCANDIIEKYGFKKATIALGVLLGFFLILLILLCIFHKKNGESEDYDRRVSQTENKNTENNNQNYKNNDEIKVEDIKVEDKKEENVDKKENEALKE